MAAQETRALLTARKLVQSKLYDIEMSLRGILCGFGLKVGPTTSKRFARRIEDLVAGHATLELIAKGATRGACGLAARVRHVRETRAGDGAHGQTRQAGHVDSRRRRDRRADLCFGDRRSVAFFVVESG
jgi:hypothetical protein